MTTGWTLMTPTQSIPQSNSREHTLAHPAVGFMNVEMFNFPLQPSIVINQEPEVSEVSRDFNERHTADPQNQYDNKE